MPTDETRKSLDHTFLLKSGKRPGVVVVLPASEFPEDSLTEVVVTVNETKRSRTGTVTRYKVDWPGTYRLRAQLERRKDSYGV